MVRIVHVAIPEEAVAKLVELARRDFRAPKQQAALLLTEAIERATRGPDKAAEPALAQERRS